MLKDSLPEWAVVELKRYYFSSEKMKSSNFSDEKFQLSAKKFRFFN
jgi:hypothetical protein